MQLTISEVSIITSNPNHDMIIFYMKDLPAPPSHQLQRMSMTTTTMKGEAETWMKTNYPSILYKLYE